MIGFYYNGYNDLERTRAFRAPPRETQAFCFQNIRMLSPQLPGGVAPVRRRPELWRAFQQNDQSCPARRCTPLKKQNGAPAPCAAGGQRVKSAQLRGAATPRQRARAERPAILEAADAPGVEGLAHQARRRLPPIPRPSQLGKRKDEGVFEAQAKGTRPRNVPMCLCCGGLLRASEEARAGGAQPDSLLLKCAKCGIISRVAS